MASSCGWGLDEPLIAYLTRVRHLSPRFAIAEKVNHARAFDHVYPPSRIERALSRHVPGMGDAPPAPVSDESTAVFITLREAGPSGTVIVTSCHVDARTLTAAANEVVASFRSMSLEKGMQMTDQEIRDSCWAPMMEKLAEKIALGGDQAFESKALCFFAWAAFGERASGCRNVDVLVDRNRNVRVARYPRRWWRHDRRLLGNLPPKSR